MNSIWNTTVPILVTLLRIPEHLLDAARQARPELAEHGASYMAAALVAEAIGAPPPDPPRERQKAGGKLGAERGGRGRGRAT